MGNISKLLFSDEGVDQSPTQRGSDMTSFILAMMCAAGASFFLDAAGIIIIGVSVYAGLRFLQRGGY